MPASVKFRAPIPGPCYQKPQLNQSFSTSVVCFLCESMTTKRCFRNFENLWRQTPWDNFQENLLFFIKMFQQLCFWVWGFFKKVNFGFSGLRRYSSFFKNFQSNPLCEGTKTLKGIRAVGWGSEVKTYAQGSENHGSKPHVVNISAICMRVFTILKDLKLGISQFSSYLGY